MHGEIRSPYEKVYLRKGVYWLFSMLGIAALIGLYFLAKTYLAEGAPPTSYADFLVKKRSIVTPKLVRTFRFIADWLGPAMALWISAACCFYYQTRRIPFLGVFTLAFLGIACVNTFHFLVVEKVIFVNFPALWSAFSWWVNRLYFAIIFLASIILGAAYGSLGVHARAGALTLTFVIFLLLAGYSITNGLSIERIPRTFFDRTLFRVSFNLIPIVLLCFALYPTYTLYTKTTVTYFSYFLWISLIPNILAELYVVFTPTVDHMNSLNLAHLLELYGLALPLLGIILDNRFITSRPLKPPPISPLIYQSENYFLSSLSIQMRNPLNAILSYADCLEKGFEGDLNDQQRSAILSIAQCAGKLSALTNEFIDASRMRKGSLIFASEQTDLRPLIQKLSNTLRPSIEQQGLSLVLDIPEGDPLVYIDPTRLKQVLHQLLSNAKKYTHEGQITIHVRLEEQELFIDVIDTGIGIPEEKRETLFEAFSEMYTYKRIKKTGIGLGLAIAKKVITEMGGKLDFTTEEGKGTTFTIQLPRYTEEAKKHDG